MTQWHFKAKVNYFEKYKGLRKGPDLQMEEIPTHLPEHMTKRTVLRLVNTVYDPLGLIVPFTIKLKLQMRRIFVTDATKTLDWDSPILPEMREAWIELLTEMFEVERISFPRCIKPNDYDLNEQPILVTFSDGSCDAFCACSYIQWKLVDGTHKALLVSAKARVGPINKISIPRMELQGALINSRLHNTIKNNIGIKFKTDIHIVDSGAVKDMITKESSACKELVGTRIGKIRSNKTNVNDWAWVQSKDNPADIGTRGINPISLHDKSIWQNGPDWLRLHYSSWPINYDYKEDMPAAELLPVYLVNRVNIALHIGNVIDINKFNSLDKLLRSTAIVQKMVRERTFKISPLTQIELEMAENSWERDAQQLTEEAFKRGRLKNLRAVKRDDGMIVVSGRAGQFLTVGYDRDNLVVLMPNHRYAKLYLKNVHEGVLNIDHHGILADLSKSRDKYWIPQAKRILSHIRRNCFKCRLMDKRLEKQIMAPLPLSRLKPEPLWHTTSLDMFGPLQIIDAIKRRVAGKCWGLLAACTRTRLVHLDITENYSTDSVIMALRRFIVERGCIFESQSDPGSQLKASANEISKEIRNWSWDDPKFYRWASFKGIKWTISPVAAPHMNGCSESLIKITKRSLCDVLKNKKITFGELSTITKEVQHLMNSRPLGVTMPNEDPTAGGLLTGNHLLLGRATAKLPQGPFCSDNKLTKRFRFVEQTVDEWWNKWMKLVFPSLVPSYRWHRKYRNVSIGDIVLMKEESVLIRGEYKIGRVCGVKVGSDNNVRRAIVEYKICDGSVNKFPKDFKRSERAIHNLCVVVPAGYTNVDVETDLNVDCDRDK